MKKLLFLSILTFYLISCDQDKSINENIIELNANELLTQYNNELTDKWGVVVPELKKGIMSTGELRFELKRKESDGRMYASFVFAGVFGNESGVQYRRFDFGVNEKLEFPAKVDNAEILFLGNQLIIKDPSGEGYLNLYVDNGKINKASQLKKIEGYMLRTISGSGFDTLRNSECSCDCVPCTWTPCPTTISCSCSCGAGGCSCSTECSGINEAVCKCDCSEQ